MEKRQYQRYDETQLRQVVAECVSFTEVCRRLGKKPVGGTITNIKVMCYRWNIDISHMTGQGWKKGKRSSNRKLPEDVLKMGLPMDHRVSCQRLKPHMFDVGFKHICNMCGIDSWNGQHLVLEIDHIDGQYWNNTKENLQFICPNCHSQKTNKPR